MKAFRKMLATGAILLCAILVVSACGGKGTQSNQGANSPGDGAGTSSAPAGKVKIVFYGKLVGKPDTDAILSALAEKFKDQYEIEAIQVDTANLDRVIKTGIASGTPADIYFKQAQYMKSYVDANQALDLTPYLEANDGEWKKTFNQKVLEIGKYDGKYYNIPFSVVFSNIYINKEIFDKAGIEVPDRWSWEEFMAVCEKIKTDTGVFPFATSALTNDFMARNAVLSLGNDQNLLDDLAAGKVEATADIFRTALGDTKALYDNGYWYPGEGAMTSTRDQVIAAFQQGKVAMLADVNNIASQVMNGAQFEVSVARWPAVGTQNLVLGGADGYFIPVNAPHKEAAVEILKYLLGDEIQKIHANAGFISPNANVQADNPILNALSKISGEVYPYEFMYLSTKMQSFWQDVLIEDYTLGRAEDELLNEMERLRKEAISE